MTQVTITPCGFLLSLALPAAAAIAHALWRQRRANRLWAAELRRANPGVCALDPPSPAELDDGRRPAHNVADDDPAAHGDRRAES